MASPRRAPTRRSLAALAGVALLVACGGDDGDDRTAELDAVEVSDRVVVVTPGRSYDPDLFVVEGPTEIFLDNQSGEFHDLRVEGGGFFVEAGAGGSATAILDLEPGDYTFYCSIPGHRPAGMEGRFRVVG